jgi:hypothetical protein
LARLEASGAFRSTGVIPMQTLFGLIIPFVLIHHGFNSIALKIISEIKSGLKYWRETTKR